MFINIFGHFRNGGSVDYGRVIPVSDVECTRGVVTGRGLRELSVLRRGELLHADLTPGLGWTSYVRTRRIAEITARAPAACDVPHEKLRVRAACLAPLLLPRSLVCAT